MDKPSAKSLSIFKNLNEANWEEIYPRLVLFAKGKASAHHRFWRSGNHEDLADGFQAEDLVQEAIKRVYEGKRVWDPEKSPDLFKFLSESVISSLISNLVTSDDNTIVEKFPVMEKEGTQEEIVAEPVNLADPLDPHACNLIRPNLNPQELYEKRQNDKVYKNLSDEIIESAKGDEIVETILVCMIDDIFKPLDIANVTGYSILEINNAQKRLRRLVLKINQKNPFKSS